MIMLFVVDNLIYPKDPKKKRKEKKRKKTLSSVRARIKKQNKTAKQSYIATN